ncbi:MAG TPA: hypothetical protein VGW75_03290 [Solirubrobacteraceae bacterium]|jgi:hypothetical protein|nr:hypothetical protein [Solirubrobacteraceae bacterium]
MRLYPDLPSARARTVAADAAVLVAVLLLAWLGLRVHDAVMDLTPVSDGVQAAGGAVQGAFETAADRVSGAPVVGGQVGDALREAGRETGGEAVEAGRAGEEGIADLANLLGWLTFLVPAGLLLSRALPPRVEQVRRLTAADRVLRAPEDGERRALLARRAAFGLPYATLLRHTPDPLGDLAAGRLDALVAAVREDAGLR